MWRYNRARLTVLMLAFFIFALVLPTMAAETPDPTACDGDGNPTPNLSGNKHIHNKKYESLGIIVKRDVANSLVRLIDESSRLQFVVPFHDIWDIDEIEWVNEFA